MVLGMYTYFYSADVAWQNVALVFSAIMFLIAAIYLGTRIGFYRENYQTILKENYKLVLNGDKRGCCDSFVTGNALLIVVYLLILGVAPIILYPLPFGQYILLILLLLVLVMLAITLMPCCLSYNNGKGSVDFGDGEYCEGGCCCSCCLTREAKRPCSSDFLHLLLSVIILSLALCLVATVNLFQRFFYPGAWLFWFAAVLGTTGLFCLWEFNMPTPTDEAELEELHAFPNYKADDERTNLV